MADSHDRNISGLVQQRTSINISSFIKPNANFNSVVDNIRSIKKNLGRNDYLMMVGGKNDIGNANIKHLVSEIHSIILTSGHTNLILATVPTRHDTTTLDLEIAAVNAELERIADKYSHVTLFPLHLLPHHLFTKHSMDLNKKGKNNVANMVVNILQQKLTEKNDILGTQSFTETYSKGKINIIDANLHSIMRQMRSDHSFAHAISSEFDHQKHMTAGVAVL